MTRRAETPPGAPHRSQREHQRERTRTALVDGARALIRSGGEVTMPAIARHAEVSEATAYRYFPDLLSVLREGFVGVLPNPETLMPDLAACPDPVERIGIAAETLVRSVVPIQGAVRTMISLTIASGDAEGVRPAHRLGFIDSALRPAVDAGADSATLDRLRDALSVVISAEALFTLLDLRGLSVDAVVDTMRQSAQRLVRAALDDLDPTA